MYCKNCGISLADGTAVCLNCGCLTEGAKKQSVSEKKAFISGIISGIISILGGIIIFLFMDTGSSNEYISYGGDAYTGIQQASAQAANNILALANIVKFGLAVFLISFGLAIISYFMIKGKKSE